MKNKLDITYHTALLLIMKKYGKARNTTYAMAHMLTQVIFLKKNKLRIFFR